jgi:hypothetical protein
VNGGRGGARAARSVRGRSRLRRREPGQRHPPVRRALSRWVRPPLDTRAGYHLDFSERGLTLIEETSTRSSSLILAIEALEALEVGGPGAETSGGGVIGGGFGLEGMVVGMLAATALNAVTTRTKITTLLRVQGRDCELIFVWDAMTPDELRIALAPVIGWMRAAQAQASMPTPASIEGLGSPTLATEVMRLGELRDQGLLSDEEFALAKAKLFQPVS